MADQADVFEVSCKRGHKLTLSVSELEELLEDSSCPECGAGIHSVEPEEVEIECVCCYSAEVMPWEDASAAMFSGCGRCQSNTETDGRWHLVGSFYHQMALYYDRTKVVNVDNLVRHGRPDYWEAVIHFCTRNEMLGIEDGESIQASPTGFFRVPAVCLTEVPLVYSEDVRRAHGDYGLAFKKSDVLQYGGGPAVYLTDRVITEQLSKGGFSDALRPFINVVRLPSTAPTQSRKRLVDFLHEREWRVPCDIDLEKLKPIGLVFPKGHPSMKFSGPRWENLLKFAYHYGELTGD